MTFPALLQHSKSIQMLRAWNLHDQRLLWNRFLRVSDFAGLCDFKLALTRSALWPNCVAITALYSAQLCSL